MPLEIASNAIHSAAAFGAKAVQITGGEPLCYLDLIEVVKLCKEKGLYCMIATSGYGHSIDKYRELLNSGLSAICVSLNSIVQKVNNKTRQGFHYSMKAIEDAIEVGIPCFVNIVVNQDNFDTLAHTISVVRSMGACGVVLLKRFPNFKGEKFEPISCEQLSKIHDLIKDNDFVMVENCYKEYWSLFYNKSEKCLDCGNKSIFWNSDGRISPCSQKTMYKYSSVHEMSNYNEWKEMC